MYFLLPVINKYRKKICINFTLLFLFVCVLVFVLSKKSTGGGGGGGEKLKKLDKDSKTRDLA